MSVNRRIVWTILAFWALTGAVGCIAVSREVRREVPPGTAGAVSDGGQWEVEQEWQCRASREFELDRERREFDDAREGWLDLGWELTGISVVPVPASADAPDRICLVGSYRRRIGTDS
jgi:hypothetical protein